MTSEQTSADEADAVDQCVAIFVPSNLRCELKAGHYPYTVHHASGRQWIDTNPTVPAWKRPGVKA